MFSDFAEPQNEFQMSSTAPPLFTLSPNKKPPKWNKKITMSMMPQLSRLHRDQAIAMLQGGRSARIIARTFGVHHSTVTPLAECYRITGYSNDRAISGRPCVMTAAQDRAKQLSYLLPDRFQPATQTAAETIGTHHRPVSARRV